MTKPGAVWLRIAPVLARPFYPPFIDLAEELVRVSPTPLSALCATHAAISWEELVKVGITNDYQRGPGRDDALEQDGSTLEDLFIDALKQIVEELKGEINILWSGACHLDHLSRRAFSAVQHASEESNGRISVKFHYYSRTIFNRDADEIYSRCSTRDWVRYIAVAPQGLPLEVILNLGISETEIPPNFIHLGPGQRQWIHLPNKYRKHALASIPKPIQQTAHLKLANSWPPVERDYVRSAFHALASGDSQIALSHYLSYFYGLKSTGRDYLYRYVCGLAKLLSHINEPIGHLSEVHAVAARLAPRVLGGGGFYSSIKHYKRCLALEGDPYDLTRTAQELANVYANLKTPETLKKARYYYSAANHYCNVISEGAEKITMQIRILNGLALVEYHEQSNQAALALEVEATRISDACKEHFPRITEWARPLLNGNIAKLLSHRMDDPEGALSLLKEVECTGSPEARVKAQIEMGRLHIVCERPVQGLAMLKRAEAESSNGYLLETHEEVFLGLLIVIAESRVGNLEAAQRKIKSLSQHATIIQAVLQKIAK